MQSVKNTQTNDNDGSIFLALLYPISDNSRAPTNTGKNNWENERSFFQSEKCKGISKFKSGNFWSVRESYITK